MNRKAAILAVVLAAVVGAAPAQTYPSKPIKIISPFSAGGGNDFLARFLSVRLGAALGQPVVVENKPGAGGMMGTDLVAKAAPDGHTILLGSNGPLSVLPALGVKTPYDTSNDLVPVALLTKQPFVLLTHAASPLKDCKQFIAMAKAQPDKLNYGTAGTGSAPHLAVEALQEQAGIRMTHIPYKGASPAINDLVAGQIQLSTADPNTAAPLLKQGRLRALAVTTARRSPLLPEVPTLAECGVKGFDVAGWFGVLVPANTPAPIVARLQSELARLMATPEAKEGLANLGGELMATTPVQFTQHIKAETARWRQLVTTLNIKPDNN
jgi:tripartite-type tricarboxylate transporter receptor subunit TctC